MSKSNTVLELHTDSSGDPRAAPRQGMLAIGAALLGSPHVIGVDIDARALDTAGANVDAFEDMQACCFGCWPARHDPC